MCERERQIDRRRGAKRTKVYGNNKSEDRLKSWNISLKYLEKVFIITRSLFPSRSPRRSLAFSSHNSSLCTPVVRSALQSVFQNGVGCEPRKEPTNSIAEYSARASQSANAKLNRPVSVGITSVHILTPGFSDIHWFIFHSTIYLLFYRIRAYLTLFSAHWILLSRLFVCKNKISIRGAYECLFSIIALFIFSGSPKNSNYFKSGYNQRTLVIIRDMQRNSNTNRIEEIIERATNRQTTGIELNRFSKEI